MLSLIAGLFSYNKKKEAARAQQGYYNFLADSLVKETELLQQYSDRQVGYINKTAEKNITFTQDKAASDTKQLKDIVDQVEGSQKATMAASGLSLNSATAEDIINDTEDKARMDEAAIRYNADIESYQIQNEANIASYETKYRTALNTYNLLNQADSYRIAGRNALKAGEADAYSSLLGSALTASQQMYNFIKG